MEFTLLWAVLTAAVAGRVAIWLAKPGPEAADLLIGSAATGLLVGRLAAMVGNGVNPVLHPADIIIVRAGVSTGFATLAALGMLGWLTRADHKMLDRLAPAALAALAGWHGGCLWRGTCLGTAGDVPWAWAQPGSLISRHPVELYTFAVLVAGAWLVWKLSSRMTGVAGGAALVLAAASRLATQPFRPSLSGGPVGWYLAGIGAGLVWIAAGFRSQRHPDTAARTLGDLDATTTGLDDSLGDG